MDLIFWLGILYFMSDKWKNKKIKISELSLWDENPRFPDSYFEKTEKDLIEYFLSRDDFNIGKFAREVVGEIDVPQLEKLVVLSHGQKNVVVEGNRRLVVFKLLASPSLASNPEVSLLFARLNLSAQINDNFSLETIVTDDSEECLRLVERKHLKFNNEVSWGDAERANYSVRHGEENRETLLRAAIAKKIRDSDIPSNIASKVLGKGYVTTLRRITTSSAASSAFGYSLADGSLVASDPGFMDKLKAIVVDVLRKESHSGQTINSRTINSLDEIRIYLDSITNEAIAESRKILSGKSKNILGEDVVKIPAPKNKKSTKKAVPSSTSRSHLIPGSCTLRIQGQQKINNMYHELRERLLLDDSNKSCPNAVAVLLRVFLETTIDWFLEKHGEAISETENLPSKIPRVVNILESQYAIPSASMSAIRKVGSSNPSVSILSITAFNQYIHSLRSQPLPTDLKIVWDDLEEFFTLVWEILDKKYRPKTR